MGDKTSLVVAPIVSSCGVKVAKISGRGLGHTGGTVDKLSSIPGFSVELNEKEFTNAVNETGMAIIGQSKAFAPADKILYAIRDVTATVDSIPLIAASIMGKKLASDDDCIVLDVKTGVGAFMKTKEESEALARAMVDIGKRAGKKICAMITDMEEPLGYAVGNALEVNESVETLRGNGEKRFTELCLRLSAKMLFLAGKGNEADCYKQAKDALFSGRALKTFASFVEKQGGDKTVCDKPLSLAPIQKEIRAKQTGYLTTLNAEKVGQAALLLGAGRNKAEDAIDFGAGAYLWKKTGDLVNENDVLATFYTSKKETLSEAETVFSSGIQIEENKPKINDIVWETIE